MRNVFGGPEQVLLRNNAKVYDINSYVTLFITILQLEAALLPGGPELREEELSLALDAIHSFHDHNKEEGSSIFVFFPQKFNKTCSLWVCYGANLNPVAADEKVFSEVLTWLLSDLGMNNESEHLKEFTEHM